MQTVNIILLISFLNMKRRHVRIGPVVKMACHVLDMGWMVILSSGLINVFVPFLRTLNNPSIWILVVSFPFAINYALQRSNQKKMLKQARAKQESLPPYVSYIFLIGWLSVIIATLVLNEGIFIEIEEFYDYTENSR